MMHNWFEAKVRYEKVMDNGLEKKVTEPYLVDALSFTEAEAKIIAEMTPFISGEFSVSDIKHANYAEVVESPKDEDDTWFKCKIAFITLNEKSGVEKRVMQYMLVQAADLRVAVANLDNFMKGTMADYAIISVQETAVMDVFPYSEDMQNSVNETKAALEKQMNHRPSDNEFPADATLRMNAADGAKIEVKDMTEFLESCPAGVATEIKHGDKILVIDKTTPGKTVVRPMTESSE